MLQRISDELPIFPLEGVVLMPGSLLPLHVFEPRYRRLVEFVREGVGLMGIATLTKHDADDAERPPIWPEVGVGQIVGYQPFHDGRSNIVLQYVGGVEVEAELDSPHPFRLVRGRPLALDVSGSDAVLRALHLMVLQLGAITPKAAAEARRLVDLEPVELVDSLARRLLQDTDEQRAYLRSERLVERIDMVRTGLAGFMAVASPHASA